MDPFATLGIGRSFAVDLAAVEKTHRELSRALHPDRYAGATTSERQAALAKAIEVNDAFRIVRDPIRRADALLALSGVTAGGEESRTGVAQEFLVDMLGQREALSDAKHARDLAAVRELASAVDARFAAVERVLREGFERGEAASLAGKVDELRFYRRFLEEVSAIEDELAA
ncbi:MAG: Fe-S protein assembly co-chaperone HscB [Polyangiaceae bacterium]